MPSKTAPTASKRIGGTERAEKARRDMRLILENEEHPLYFAKDIELARLYDVSRHTIYHIREELGVLPRAERLLKRLQALDLRNFTLKELSKMCNVKYQNLYKVIQENGLEIKPDTPPIEFLKEYQSARKGLKKKRLRKK